MKKLILVLALAVPGFLMAQMNEDQLWENAVYQVIHDGATVFYTDVNVLNSDFSESMLEDIKAKMFQKEGIVKVEFQNSNRTIRVYHFDYIELETVKNFVLAEKREIDVMNRVEFSMN